MPSTVLLWSRQSYGENMPEERTTKINQYKGGTK
jgi:hypothetical protein